MGEAERQDGPGDATLLVIDDHPLVRDALCANLARAGFDTVRTASTLSEGLPLIADGRPDLVLLDLELGDASGLEGLSRLQGTVPDLPVMIVSSHDDPSLIARARALGAKGFLTKNEPGEAIAAAVRTVLEGGEAFPEALTPERAEDSPAQRLTTLTPAQRRVTGFLAEGLLNKQIAFEMGISEATVKAHMTAIFRKLGVNNRTQALLVLNAALKA
ncbi:response regulator transcription factor [uncultured Algimonas sp.]|uniref:response regulator transcription factor n=1 Tax=uncultured Algimonas sp. TaxID=1547920 RepID=UPI0026066C7E|nr:response regulator transcription factor [uncultured Algimonas sp.]